MSLLTNSISLTKNLLITDPTLLEDNCMYKIRMDNILLKNGNLFKFIGRKVLSNVNVNNDHGLNGVFYHFKQGKNDEYFGEIWISLYTFEKINEIKDESDNIINFNIVL